MTHPTRNHRADRGLVHRTTTDSMLFPMRQATVAEALDSFPHMLASFSRKVLVDAVRLCASTEGFRTEYFVQE